MKSFQNILCEALSDMKLSDKDKKHLLELDKKYGELFDEFFKEVTHYQNVIDVHSSIVKFRKYYKEGKEYFPDNHYEDSKFKSDEYTKKFIKKLNELMDEFVDFPQCYLSQFYITEIRRVRGIAEFYNMYEHDHDIVKDWYFKRPTKEVYEEALKVYKDNPFVDPKELAKKDKDYVKDKPAPDCIPIMQKEIDRQGYDWTAKCDPNLIPRMSVKTYNEFVIKKSKMFSTVDLNSLMVHEINTHVRRKHEGRQRGLNLFLYGIGHADDLDEGIAIRVSLAIDKPKPNILFYIAQKIIINYWIGKKTFNELYDFLKKITPGYLDDQILYALHRNYRCTFYSTERDLSWSFDTAYFEGYRVVKDLSDKECETLMKYNIGVPALPDLDNIIKFCKENNLKPLKK